MSLGRAETVTEVDGDVQVSHVRLHSPLPAGFPEHPAGMDSLNHLRYRLVSGPGGAADADAILIMQPGAWAGAHSLDRLARNVVRAAARQGLTVEFWSVARRGDGGTDLTGLHAARSTGDLSVAVDYYFGGADVDGKTFEGWRRGKRLRYVAELGLAQAVRDQYELITRELPAPGERRAKVFAGGHSLGGFIAGAFAGWDFDGVAGHEQIDGLIALDTLVTADPLGLDSKRWSKPIGALAGPLHPAIVAGLRAGVVPRTTSFMQLTRPKALMAVHLVGLAAMTHGSEETDLHRLLPHSPFFTGFFRALAARGYRDLLRRRGTSVRDLRFTGDGLLGHLMGAPFLPVDALQVTLGASDGPTLPRTSLPLPGVLRRVPGLRDALAAVFAREITGVPYDRDALYGWKPGGPVDLVDFALQVSGGPLSYLETYFPTRIHLDLFVAACGGRWGSLRPLKHTVAAAAKPTLFMMADPDRLVGYLLKTARLTPPQHSSAEGYSHVDVIAAADRPGEPVCTALAEFLAREAAAAARIAEESA